MPPESAFTYGLINNIWERFGYASLFDTANSEEVGHRLTEADVNLFERLANHNFEVVLSALSVSATIVDALNYKADFLIERSDSIRRALIAAVHHVHLPWVSFTEASKAGIANAFAEYEFVYATNYDLLAYWAVMHSPRRFKDFFWGEEFDVTNTKIWGKCTKVLYTPFTS